MLTVKHAVPLQGGDRIVLSAVDNAESSLYGLETARVGQVNQQGVGGAAHHLTPEGDRPILPIAQRDIHIPVSVSDHSSASYQSIFTCPREPTPSVLGEIEILLSLILLSGILGIFKID